MTVRGIKRVLAVVLAALAILAVASPVPAQSATGYFGGIARQLANASSELGEFVWVDQDLPAKARLTDDQAAELNDELQSDSMPYTAYIVQVDISKARAAAGSGTNMPRALYQALVDYVGNDAPVVVAVMEGDIVHAAMYGPSTYQARTIVAEAADLANADTDSQGDPYEAIWTWLTATESDFADMLAEEDDGEEMDGDGPIVPSPGPSSPSPSATASPSPSPSATPSSQPTAYRPAPAHRIFGIDVKVVIIALLAVVVALLFGILIGKGRRRE